MKVYKNIIFDLFDTLILFKPELLTEIKINGRIHYSTGPDVYNIFTTFFDNYSFEEFYSYFSKSYKNFQDLKDLDNREYPNSKRFQIMLDDMNLTYTDTVIDKLVVAHMDSLEKSMVFPEDHRKVLNYLAEKSYNLSILSNFDYSPKANYLLEKYSLTQYFSNIIISDIFGWRKPDIKIFEFAIEENNINREDTIFIGDDLERDIKGAYNAKIDTIYINLKQINTEFSGYAHSVKNLSEITQFL